jgi:hypothetical protein
MYKGVMAVSVLMFITYFVKTVGTEVSRGMHAALWAYKPLFPKREENTLTAKICKVKI